jgi:hypothetical protein
MTFGRLELNPATSPAVLDTATWDRDAACRELTGRRELWSALRDDLVAGTARTRRMAGTPFPHAVVVEPSRLHCLVALDDGQRVFVRIGGSDGDSPLGQPICRLSLGGESTLFAYPADAPAIDAYCRILKPANAPRALGRTPRLGIGTRMTTMVWPAIFAAMDRKGFAANCIQNSVRELNLLEDLKAGREPERNYASGFGMIESGYTGSTFEGLWAYGVLAALEHDRPLVYGADADHVQFKRADRDLARAARVVRAARYYTLFTLDTADVLSYDMFERRGAGELLLEQEVASPAERSDILAWHAEPLRVGARAYRLDADTVGRCVAKYWAALDATAALCGRIEALRGGTPFDLEFAFDEHPPEVPGPDCISTEEEVVFVVRELARRGVPATHIAPNFGIEKGFDYRIADGLPGLQARVEAIHRIADATGFLLDFHSADDLSAATRKAIGRATAGRLHYKISPMLHFIMAQTVRDCAPELFQRWWNDAIEYAQREAGNGSAIAADSLAALRGSADPTPAPEHEVFRHFFFAYLGRRDSAGRFVNRERFYTLPAECTAAYQERVRAHLESIADDLFVT